MTLKHLEHFTGLLDQEALLDDMLILIGKDYNFDFLISLTIYSKI